MSDGLVTKILILSLKQRIPEKQVLTDYMTINESIRAYNNRGRRLHNPKENYILNCLNKGYTRIADTRETPINMKF